MTTTAPHTHADALGFRLVVGATVRMASSTRGPRGKVVKLSHTANGGTPYAEVYWADGTLNLHSTNLLRRLFV